MSIWDLRESLESSIPWCLPVIAIVLIVGVQILMFINDRRISKKILKALDRDVKKERMSKYWICDACAALKRGWVPYKTGYTVCQGLCGWCDSDDEVMLTPLRDLRNAKGVRADCERGES